MRPDIDTRAAALGILGACNRLTHCRAGGRLTIEEVADSLLALLLGGATRTCT